MPVAIFRKFIEKLPEVSRTWFEWDFVDGSHVKTLVIEVSCSTDPNEEDGEIINVINHIDAALAEAAASTTMVVHRVRVVPERACSAGIG